MNDIFVMSLLRNLYRILFGIPNFFFISTYCNGDGIENLHNITQQMFGDQFYRQFKDFSTLTCFK